MAIYIGKGNDDIFDPITMGDARAFISDSWNNTKSYVKGDYAIDNNILWKCLADNTGIKPTEGTYWTRVNVGSELQSVRNEITEANTFTTQETILTLGTFETTTPIPSQSWGGVNLDSGKKLSDYKYLCIQAYDSVLGSSSFVISVEVFKAFSTDKTLTIQCQNTGASTTLIAYANDTAIAFYNQRTTLCYFGISGIK